MSLEQLYVVLSSEKSGAGRVAGRWIGHQLECNGFDGWAYLKQRTAERIGAQVSEMRMPLNVLQIPIVEDELIRANEGPCFEAFMQNYDVVYYVRRVEDLYAVRGRVDRLVVLLLADTILPDQEGLVVYPIDINAERLGERLRWKLYLRMAEIWEQETSARGG